VNWRATAKKGWHSRTLRLALACTAGLAANAVLYFPFLHYTPDTDFLGLYPGGKLCGSAQLYDIPSVLAVQRQAVGHDNVQGS
jgi:hypothetical protein